MFQVYDVKQAVYEFVKVGAKGRGGSSPLHLACSRDTSSVGRYPICNFPSVPTIDLLLQCGAPVNARDNVRLMSDALFNFIKQNIIRRETLPYTPQLWINQQRQPSYRASYSTELTSIWSITTRKPSSTFWKELHYTR